MAPALPHKGDAMILLNSVLVATDFGETSRQALEYGRNLARAFGGTLHLLHVVDSVVLASAAEFYPHGPRDVEAELIEEAKNGLEAFLTGTDREQLHTVPAVRVAGGSVAAAIVKYAKQAHVDVIVVGTHGRGAIGRFFLGSVAERVARTAPCPVLVVRPTEHQVVVPDAVGQEAAV